MLINLYGPKFISEELYGGWEWGKKDRGGLINFLPLKRRWGDLEDDLCYKGNKYKLSAQ